ncbi:hypothetical protein TSUD_21910 [Trifolium subterraneum]|uniref:Uncharacterized protein n=1 Tax=Trifolium subterraneum TaxID=3900 RepID=A0A2Z6M8P2_TRISU|nr:hypothetical protein TSUD_21910 [Trifolium subterraneum]
MEKRPFDSSLENSRLSNVEVGTSSFNLSEIEIGLKGCLNLNPEQLPSTVTNFSEVENNQMYCSEFHSMEILQKDRIDNQLQCSNHDDGVNFELPPLPGEEDSSSHDHVLWSNSEMMMNLPFQVTQPPPPPPLLGPDQIHDADLLIGTHLSQEKPQDSKSADRDTYILPTNEVLTSTTGLKLRFSWELSWILTN